MHGRQADCPLEDSGGICGHYTCPEALTDPDSEMHDETVEWVSKGSKLKALDVDAVDRKPERMQYEV